MEEDYSFEKAETRYKIETVNPAELELYINAPKMHSALHELLGWRNSLENGKDWDYEVMCDGKRYTANEWATYTMTKTAEELKELKDKGILYFYTDDTIIRNINEIIRTCEDFIYKYY